MKILVLALCGAFVTGGAFAQTGPSSAEDRRMVIEMRTGETHPTPAPPAPETRFWRWFDLQIASISNRYQFVGAGNPRSVNQEQYQLSFKGRLKFDADGKFSLNAGVFSGRSFFGGWNNSGWGAGRAVSNLHLKQLYLSARPVRGVEFEYGGLPLLHGEATEVTAYDYDGYITGQRVTIARPDTLYFDEVSYTAGYLGDINTPNINKRYHRLRQVNYHHFLIGKKLNERVRVSADYARERAPGRESNIFRQATKIKAPELRVIDALLVENYQRAGRLTGYGLNIYAEKSLHHRLTLGGGYAQIDRNGLNSDRFVQGKRLHLNALMTLSPEFSLGLAVTRAVGNTPANTPHTRLDISLNYNLLQSLKKVGLF